MDTNAKRTLLVGWKVVVVDDEPDSLDVASRILLFHGATVYTAANGREGLAVIREVHPHLVISDLSMPEMDGWGLVDELKRDRATLETPVIALTAHAMPGDRDRAITAGFHNYLSKPLTPATFMRDLAALLIDIPEFAGDFKSRVDAVFA